MQIFISVDMEGVAGISHWDQVDPGNPAYEKARRLMVGELNAAIQGAFDGGAEVVVVNDAHAEMRNLPPEDVWSPPEGACRVRLITGSLKELSMMEGIQEGGCAGAVFVGYHGMAGSRGVLAHTYSGSTVHSVRLNGQPVGEVTLNAAVAGAHRVPVIFVAGEATAVEEAYRSLGTMFTSAVITKSARSRYSAATLLPLDARDIIRRGVRDAVARAKERLDVERASRPAEEDPCQGCSSASDGNEFEGRSPFENENKPDENAPPPPGVWLPPAPYLIEVMFMNPGMADAASLLPGSERKSSVVVAYKSEDYLTCFKAFRCMIQLARGVN